MLLAVAVGLYGPPRIVGLIIDLLRSGKARQADVLAYAGLILLTAIISALLYWLSRRLIMGVSRRVSYRVRRDIFANLTRQDQDYFHHTRTGDLMNRLTADMTAVQEMLSFGAFQGSNTIFTVVVSLGLMIALSPALGLITLAIFPIIVLFLAYMVRIIGRRYGKVQEQSSLIAAKAQENFSGIRVVKGYAVEGREIRDYNRMNREYRALVMSLARLDNSLWPTVGLLMNAAFIIVLLLGSRGLVLAGQGGQFAGLTIGQFVQFTWYLFNLSWPVLALGLIANSMQRGATSWARLQELLDAESPIKDDGRTDRTIKTLRGDLEFQDVTLQADGRRILDHVNLKVPAGQTLGITGRTGAGKTMLASLVGRALDPTSGRVLVDGFDVRTVPLAVLRQSIGAVPQEPFLFSDTIAENIAFGLPERVSEADAPLDPQVVRWAATVAGLTKDVDDFEQGFDTELGERGVTLSGGQRQRAALARAVARKPAILILDDSMSAVDTETEARILTELRSVLADRTVLLIGHRVSTLRFADQIVVLDRGRIVERGSHDELIAFGGQYAEMDRKQGLAGSLDSDDEAGEASADAPATPETELQP